jgi:hypothetical protein
MDETALAAELLAEKFGSNGHNHTHLQEQPIHQLQSHSLSQAQAQVQAQMGTAATATAASVSYAHTTNPTYPQATGSATTVSSGEASSEPVQAYAKLEGDSFCYYIRFVFCSLSHPINSYMIPCSLFDINAFT